MYLRYIKARERCQTFKFKCLKCTFHHRMIINAIYNMKCNGNISYNDWMLLWCMYVHSHWINYWELIYFQKVHRGKRVQHVEKTPTIFYLKMPTIFFFFFFWIMFSQSYQLDTVSLFICFPSTQAMCTLFHRALSKLWNSWNCVCTLMSDWIFTMHVYANAALSVFAPGEINRQWLHPKKHYSNYVLAARAALAES